MNCCSLSTVPQTPKGWLGNNRHHTIVMMHVRVRYQEVHVPTGEACSMKQITCINNYSNG